MFTSQVGIPAEQSCVSMGTWQRNHWVDRYFRSFIRSILLDQVANWRSLATRSQLLLPTGRHLSYMQ